MRKIIVFFFVLISLFNFLYSMDNVKSSNIIQKAAYYNDQSTQNIIPKSAYYIVRNTPTFHAIFFQDLTKYPLSYLMSESLDSKAQTICFKNWDAEQQSKLDAMIDQQENLIITHAKINWHNIGTCCGRNITYYNNDQFIAIRPYNGPIDIKKDHLRIDLIKPHSLLDNIKKVEEWDDALPLHGIIGFFEPSYSHPYIKRYIEYHNDGTSHETVTLKHKLIQGIYLCTGISLIYILYYLITSSSK